MSQGPRTWHLRENHPHYPDVRIDSDSERLDLDYIHDYLSQKSYWARGRSRSEVQQTVDASCNFGMYAGEQMIGYARLISDTVIFAWLADVFIDPDHQGKGLGKWLISTIFKQEWVQGLKRVMLATADAQGLYRQYGFTQLTDPELLMQKLNTDKRS